MENPYGTDRAVLDSRIFNELTAPLDLGLVNLKPTSGSTNTELAQLASTGEAGHLSVYYTEHQQAGKGRLGREWVTPAGSSLTVSVLAVPGPGFPPESLSWYTMLAALAELLAEYLKQFAVLDRGFRQVGGMAQMPLPASNGKSLHQLVSAKLATLGHDVRVEFPDGSTLVGTAIELGTIGALDLIHS